MKKQILITSTIVLLALTGCSQSEPPNETPDSSSQSAESSTRDNVKNWSGNNETGTEYILTQGVEAPSGVEEARGYIQAATPLNYLAVTVDNRGGTSPVSVSSAEFTTPDGDLISYEILSSFLKEYDSPGLSDDESSRITEVHNAFTDDEYKVAIGEKKTVVLASETEYPAEITYASINESVQLSSSDESAETDMVSGAPAPSEPVGSNDLIADLNGTTLKGNDINFRIFSANAQKEMNNEMPSELQGTWGALCSFNALPEQLEETGASVDGAVFRSLKYATDESGLPGLSGEADYKSYEAQSLAEMNHGGSCVTVQAPEMIDSVESAEVGLYTGSAVQDTVTVQ